MIGFLFSCGDNSSQDDIDWNKIDQLLRSNPDEAYTSLQNILNRDQKTPQQISRAHRNIGIYYWYNSQLDSAEYYVNKASVTAQELNDVELLVSCEMNKALIYAIQEDYDRARNTLLSIENDIHTLHDSTLLSKLYINLGELERRTKNYIPAIEYLNRGIDISLASKDTSSTIFCINNLSIIKKELYQFEDATALLLRIPELAKKFNDVRSLASAYNNLGLLKIKEKKYNEAIDFLQQSLTYKSTVKDSIGMATTKQNLAICYAELGQNQSALSIIYEVEPIIFNKGDSLSKFTHYYIEALSHFNNNQAKKAISLSHKAENWRPKNDKVVAVSFSKFLAELYADEGLYQQQAAYLNQALTNKNDLLTGKLSELINIEKFIDLKNAQVQVLNGKIENEELKLNQFKLIGLGIFLLVGSFLGFFFFRYRQLQKLQLEVDKNILLTHKVEQLDQKVQFLQTNESGDNYQETEIIFNKKEGRKIKLKSISYIQAEHGYSVFYDTNGQRMFMINKSLQKLARETNLNEHHFTRVNRKVIINLKHVQQILKTSVILNHGYEINLSPKYIQDLSSIST